jgi:hypothetical protein
MRNLATDPEASDQLAQLFRQLYDVLDRHDVKYLQTTLQVQLSAGQADEFAGLARESGLNPIVRDR